MDEVHQYMNMEVWLNNNAELLITC